MNSTLEMANDLRRRLSSLDDASLDLLFREGRSHNGWHARPVSQSLLEELWALAQFAPTSVNCMPARLVFVTSDAGKQRLQPCLSPGNVEKVLSAPVTVIIGFDMDFWQQLPRLFPHADVRDMFRNDPVASEECALRNSCLQAAWLMLAARGLGLDCGPMSGFDSQAVDEAFFAGSTVRSNFLCNLGYGDASKLHQRLPRLSFDEVCTFA
ncbi:putative malonic semialdehyde reductase RutE [compost metagenome]|jgi:3-hydroxypropanoate dehydrogenase|uniref:malonic semialdehyde reductase n=1 Tax=Pseudomonas TaxID=286 RepID=UPI000FB161DE|nr:MULTISPECIES: malonic semialdehyde reductase [Pseudomonas]WPN32210.1 malonic semialdehyde reductase [Pseudomonas sp. P5_109]VVP20280.1 putative malonic semialdehyde reductase RutE [Pseudomonas fluorescens]